MSLIFLSGAHDFSRILGGHKFPYSFLPKKNHYISVLTLDRTGGPPRNLIVADTLHLKVFIHYSISSLIDKYDWTTTHFSTSKHSNPIFEKSIKSTYSIVIFRISSAEKNFQTNGKENHVSSKNIRWKLVSTRGRGIFYDYLEAEIPEIIRICEAQVQKDILVSTKKARQSP